MQSNSLAITITRELLSEYLDWHLLYKNPTEEGLSSQKYHAKSVLTSPILLGKEFNLKNALVFINHLKQREARGEISRNTVYSYVKILRSVSEYLSTTRGLVDIRDKLPKIRREETAINPLTPEEIDRIISAPVNPAAWQRRPVMYNALISLLAYSGRRISDIRKLKVKDVDFESGFMLLGSPKGGRPEWVPLPDGSTSHLKRYLSEKRPNPHGYLFPSPSKKDMPMWRSAIAGELKRRAKEVGVTKPVNPHNFRHSFARPLLRNKVPLNVVGGLLGHRSIVTTMRYTHMLPEDLKEASVMHPANKRGIPGEKVAAMLLEFVELYRGAKTSFKFDTKTKNKSLDISFKWDD